MKIAIAISEGNKVSRHFGRSPLFKIYEIVDGKLSNSEERINSFTHHVKRNHTNGTHDAGHNHDDPNRHNHSHKGVLEGLHDCDVVICGGMGQGAYDALLKAGKRVIITDLDMSEMVAQKFVEGGLVNNLHKLH